MEPKQLDPLAQLKQLGVEVLPSLGCAAVREVVGSANQDGARLPVDRRAEPSRN